MPLLTVEPKGKPHIFKVELDANTAEQLRLYCAFTNNAQESSVFRAALNHVFTQDTEFVDWKKNPDNLTKHEPRTRRTKTQPTPAAASASASTAPSGNGATGKK